MTGDYGIAVERLAHDSVLVLRSGAVAVTAVGVGFSGDVAHHWPRAAGGRGGDCRGGSQNYSAVELMLGRSGTGRRLVWHGEHVGERHRRPDATQHPGGGEVL